jgi:hypothetical protein
MHMPQRCRVCWVIFAVAKSCAEKKRREKKTGARKGAVPAAARYAARQNLH